MSILALFRVKGFKWMILQTEYIFLLGYFSLVIDYVQNELKLLLSFIICVVPLFGFNVSFLKLRNAFISCCLVSGNKTLLFGLSVKVVQSHLLFYICFQPLNYYIAPSSMWTLGLLIQTWTQCMDLFREWSGSVVRNNTYSRCITTFSHTSYTLWTCFYYYEHLHISPA